MGEQGEEDEEGGEGEGAVEEGEEEELESGGAVAITEAGFSNVIGMTTYLELLSNSIVAHTRIWRVSHEGARG